MGVPALLIEKMGITTLPQERLLPGVGTITATPVGSSDEEAPDL
jgi:hypothetical protein